MLKRFALVALVAAIIFGAGLYFWADAVLATDVVRQTVEAQLSRALGQPVRIGGIRAGILPRVTMTLDDVRVGDPERIAASRIYVGTGLRALLSRRIEGAVVRIEAPRVELPLPAFAVGASPTPSAAPADAPVEIVSIDRIEVTDLEVVSGSQTLGGSLSMNVSGTEATIERAELNVGGTALAITGTITDLAGPTGDIVVTAGALDLLELVAFASNFAATLAPQTLDGTSTAGTAPAAAGPDPTPMRLSVSIEADTARFATLSLDSVRGTALVTPDTVRLEPVSFGIFDGQYSGTVVLTPGDEAGFQLDAELSDIDMAALMTFVGSPDLLTGRLTGTVEVTGTGLSASRVLESTAGTARLDLADGTVRGLGLVRAIVVAGSGRTGSSVEAASNISTTDAFSSLGATLAIAGGLAATRDLRFESPDLTLDAEGTLALDGSDVDLAGPARLSPELTARAGRDLVRYTAEDGRVTLPVTVGGSADDLQVGVDVGSVLRRAITNRVTEEAEEAIREGLGRLIRP